MRLSDFFVCTAILDGNPAQAKRDLIGSMLTRLAEAGYLPDQTLLAVRDSIVRREELGSTGIGRGLALPHVRHPAVARPFGILAVARTGMVFDSLDGEPVDIIALCLFPPDPPGQHIGERWRQAEGLHRCLAREEFRDRLRQAGSAEEVAALIRQEDQSGPGRRVSLPERQWRVCTDPGRMLDLLGDAGSPRQFRLFATACCRRIWHLLADGRSQAAVEAAEAHAALHANEADLGWTRRDADAACRQGPSVQHGNAAYAAFCSCLPDPRQAASFAAAYAAQAVGEEVTRQVGLAAAAWVRREAQATEAAAVCDLAREIFGNPFHPVKCDPSLLAQNESLVVKLARAAYEDRLNSTGTLDPVRLAILADALEEAGAEGELVGHLRTPGPHPCGCWGLGCLLDGR